jgi:hypothetical protein
MEKTVVEWFASEIRNHIEMPSRHFEELLEQAKQMENNQRLEDFKQGFHSAFESLESANKLVQSRTFKTK